LRYFRVATENATSADGDGMLWAFELESSVQNPATRNQNPDSSCRFLWPALEILVNNRYPAMQQMQI